MDSTIYGILQVHTFDKQIGVAPPNDLTRLAKCKQPTAVAACRGPHAARPNVNNQQVSQPARDLKRQIDCSFSIIYY